MKITLKEILFVVAIGAIALSLSSYGTAKKAPVIKSATDNSWRPIIDTTPIKRSYVKSNTKLTATDSTHQHTGNKALVQRRKNPPKNSDATQLHKIPK